MLNMFKRFRKEKDEEVVKVTDLVVIDIDGSEINIDNNEEENGTTIKTKIENKIKDTKELITKLVALIVVAALIIISKVYRKLSDLLEKIDSYLVNIPNMYDKDFHKKNN